MSLIKRGKTWHTDFFLDGQRFRQSLETSDWREAQSKEKELISAAKAGKVASKRQPISRMLFSEAAKQFLADRLSHLAPLSVRTEKERARVVNGVLGSTPVSRITPADVQAYIRKRKEKGIANATVNRELDILRGVLKKARRWHLFSEEIRPLPVKQQVGRALLHEEKVRLLKLAGSNADWQTAYFAAVLALNTTARGCELKGLRWRDVDFLNRTMTVRRSKTEAGERVIPLNADAVQVMMALRERSKKVNGAELDHFVFFACEHGHVDVTKPQKGWRTAWRNLTRAIHCPECGKLQGPAETCRNEECKADLSKVKSTTYGLRFHDLRHHAITELAESQASDSTVMSIAGHVSAKMLAHYSHVRLEAKRTALDGLSTGRLLGVEAGGYDTNHDTKQGEQKIVPPEVVDSLVELVGIEPTTSSLRTMRSPS